MTAIVKNRRGPRVPVAQLQENHLQGPAQEDIEQIRAEMGNERIATVHEIPTHETIVFRNQRDPGHMLEFHYASRAVPFKMYKLIDGHKYTLATEVIRNLEGCRENVHKYRRNSDGNPEIYIAGYKTHFVCERT